MSGNNRPPSSVLGLGTSTCSNTGARLAHTEDCPCQTGPQSPEHVLQFWPLFREAKQDYRPQSHVLQFCPLFREARQDYRPQSRVLQFCPLFREARQDYRPQSHVLQFCPLFKEARQDYRPQSHVLQFCPLFREARQDHSLMFYMSAPSSAKQDRTTVPRSTVLTPLQRSQTGPQSHVLHVCPFFRETRQDHSPTFYSSEPSSEKQDRSSGPTIELSALSLSGLVGGSWEGVRIYHCTVLCAVYKWLLAKQVSNYYQNCYHH